MKGILASGTLAMCVLGVLAASPQQQPQPATPTPPQDSQQPQVFRGSRDTVRVFATVTDKDGRLATSLKQENFEVRDDGKAQPITQFDNSAQPIQLIVLLDVSTSMEGNVPLLREAATQLFGRLAKDDVARVGTFGKDITISPTFTNNPRELTAGLPTEILPDSPTPLWRAIEQAIKTFNNEDDRRKVILVLTDGKDSGQTSFRQRPSSQADVIDDSRKEDVMIYAVGMRSRYRHNNIPPGGMGGAGGLRAMIVDDLPDPGLARVAEETGGGYIEVSYGQDLGAAFSGVADELHTQYLIAYTPPKRDGKAHEVSVKVTQSGMKTRAKKSYIAPKA